ncbi:arginine deiminase [Clostridium sp. DL1XJH146]
MEINNINLNVNSEIGKLETVLLHRPSKELENLTPEMMERLLFDDIPYLKIAQQEHDYFAETLNKCGVQVLYLENLAAETLENKEIRSFFIEDFLYEAGVESEGLKKYIKEYLKQFNEKELILKLMAGIRKKEISRYKFSALSEMIFEFYPFVIDPLPNLYFTRDPFTTIGSGIALNKMKTETRNRETIFAKYIFRHHPMFKNKEIPKWFNRYENSSLEGGDVLILNSETIAVGISQRTEATSVEKLAKKIIFDETIPFKTILAFHIPNKRAFMHLDTVFTQVDYNKFTIHPEIEEPLTVYKISAKEGSKDELKVDKEKDTLKKILEKNLNMDISLIRCGNGDIIHSAREQWNDGSNTLAIAPGEVIVYDRNYVTNELLEKNGVKIHVIPSSELSRGRGGPRCMSMPLCRKEIK